MLDRIRDFFADIPWENLGAMSSDAAGHLVAWIIIAIGFIGTFMPILPGPTIILVGAVVHRVWLGADQSMGWLCLSFLTLLVIVAHLVEYLASALGAKWYGASKWGMWGAILGGIVGIFFGIPGLFIGPLIGAFAFELVLAKKRFDSATRSTWGTLVGTALGILVKGGISVAMLAAILLDLLVW